MELLNKLIKPLPDWGQALSSTLFISIVPIFIIYALNAVFLSRPSQRDSVLCYLISFAIGGLLGDVFFHTLPHLSESQPHDHHDSGHHSGHSPTSMATNAIIIAGIVSFFLIEKVVSNYIAPHHDHNHGDHTHSHGAMNEETKKPHKTLKQLKEEEEKKAAGIPCDEASQEKEIRYKSYAIMTLIGDFLHNFTDGLSIGVAYVASN
jgi:zinc transporter 7